MILLLTNFLVRPLYLFGVEMKIQNMVGAEEFGLYFLVFDFVFLFVAINDPGLQSYSSRTLAAERSNLKTIFRGILGAKIILSLSFVVLALLGGFILGYDERKIQLIFLVAMGMVLSSIFVLLRSAISGAGKYTVDSWVSSLDRLLMIVILGALVWATNNRAPVSIEKMVIIQLMCYSIACLVCLLILSAYGLLSLPKIDLASLKSILKSTLPYAGVILLTSICNRIDVVMLNELLPPNEALFQSGIYAAGYRFLDAANMMGFLFGALLVPMYAHELSNGRSVNELFNLAFRVLLVLGVCVGLGAIAYSTQIFNLCYTEEYSTHSNIMSPLMLSLIPITLTNVFGALILATGKLKFLNYILLFGIFINVLSNYFIIPKYGAVGSAYTTFATELFLITGAYFVVGHLTKTHLDNKTILKGFTFLMVCLLFIYLLSLINFFWISKLLVFGIMAMVAAFVMKVLEWSEMKMIFNKTKP